MAWTSVGSTWYPEFRERLRALCAALPLIIISAHLNSEFLAAIKSEPTIMVHAPMRPQDLIDARNKLIAAS
jgi:hypothetical protein